MSEGDTTWPATSVWLIQWRPRQVLIDAVLTPEDAGRVVDWISATGTRPLSRLRAEQGRR